MVNYREIIRLRFLGVSQSKTALSCDCATSTVQEVEKRAREAGLIWPLPEEMDNCAIRARIYPPQDKSSKKYPINLDEVDAKMACHGVTLQLCWNEYSEQAVKQGGEPYQYSAFCKAYRDYVAVRLATMHIGCKCGEKIEVDWVGDPIYYLDPNTNQKKKAWVFVACLPWSQYIYAEAFAGMKIDSWIDAHVHAFSFFGGTTPILVPDNVKTGVIKNTLDEFVLNEQYRRMAEHYGCAVVPARPRHPKDKGSVEAEVGLVERQAIAPLRDKVFFSLSELNDALSIKIAAINEKPFQKREGSRMSAFLGQEKESLIPLPAQPYTIIVRKSATVQFNYHIAFDGMFYSVPFIYLRKQVEVSATPTSVIISYNGERIAIHARLFGHKGQYSTNQEHMPLEHRDYAEWSGDRFRKWAKEKGPSTYKVTDIILKSRQVEQQSYRSVRALLELGKRYGDAVLEEACAKALDYSPRPSYKTVKSIAVKIKESSPSHPEEHTFLRGSAYYGNGDN